VGGRPTYVDHITFPPLVMFLSLVSLFLITHCLIPVDPRTCIFQLPYTAAEVAAPASDARRAGAGKRLMEYHQRRADERIAQLEQQLQDRQEAMNGLGAEASLAQMEQLQQEIDNVAAMLKKLKAKRTNEDVGFFFFFFGFVCDCYLLFVCHCNLLLVCHCSLLLVCHCNLLLFCHCNLLLVCHCNLLLVCHCNLLLLSCSLRSSLQDSEEARAVKQRREAEAEQVDCLLFSSLFFPLHPCEPYSLSIGAFVCAVPLHRSPRQARLHAAINVNEELRLRDQQQWLASIRAERQTLLDNRTRRQRMRDEVLLSPSLPPMSSPSSFSLCLRSHVQLSNRHSEAAKRRMRLIVQQGQEDMCACLLFLLFQTSHLHHSPLYHLADASVPKSREGRRKGAEDTFGMSDEDWTVYRNLVSPPAPLFLRRVSWRVSLHHPPTAHRSLPLP
jgi:hypothetical protein